MRQHGCCSEGDSDSTCPFDRLAGLCKVISPDVIEQALSDSGRTGQKTCTLSHRTMLWVVLAMGLLTHLPIRQVFKHARRMVGGQKTPSRSNLCEARQRLGVEPVRSVFEQVVRPLATPTTPGAFYQGLRLMGIDGTVQDMLAGRVIGVQSFDTHLMHEPRKRFVCQPFSADDNCRSRK